MPSRTWQTLRPPSATPRSAWVRRSTSSPTSPTARLPTAPTGERIGWVLVPNTNPDHDELVLAVAGAGRKLGFVCAPAIFQRVVIDCIDEPSDVEAYAENRRALTEGLSALGYEFVEPQGAFYLWVKALEPDANAFFERAKSFELLPVPSDSFGCPGWVRVGYCVSHETIVNSMPAWKKLAESYK